MIELRDVSVADAPSSVLAAVSQKKVTVPADADLPFSFRAPEVDASRALSLRVHASLDGRPQVKAGDFVSTQSHPVPASGNKTGIILPLSKV